MGIRLRTVAVGALVAATSIAGWAVPAAASGKSSDQRLAQAGVLVTGDLPTGFVAKAGGSTSDAKVGKLAKGIPSCASYLALHKLTDAQPKAESPSFEDASRQVSNEVGVFKSATAASSALARYGTASVPKCLQALYAKALTQELAKQASTKGRITDVKVTITRQPISGVGDASVVYEGNAVVTGRDGSTSQIGIGNAAVQVGPAVSDYTYTTTDADLTEVLQPAIDSSLARLRAATSSA